MPSSGGHSSGSFGGGSHSAGGFNSSGHIGSTGSFNSSNHINTAHTNSNITQSAFYANTLNNRSRNRTPKKGISGIILSVIFICTVALIAQFSFLRNTRVTNPNIAVLSAVTEFPYEDEDFFSYSDDGIAPLPSGFCEFKGVYYEEPENSVYIVCPEDFNSIMEKFREVTGAEPYVVISDSFDFDDIEQAAYDKYLDLFDDEGHFLLYFVTDGNDYEYELMVGGDARSYVFSESVLSVFGTSLDNRLDCSSPEEIQYALCDTFTETLDFVNSCFSAYGESSPVRHPNVDFKDSYPFEDNEEYPFETETFDNGVIDEFLGGFSGSNRPNINSDAVISVIRIGLIVFAVLFAVTVVIILRKKQNAEEKQSEDSFDLHSDDVDSTDDTDSYDGLCQEHNQDHYNYDNYDEQFKKRESKYDEITRK